MPSRCGPSSAIEKSHKASELCQLLKGSIGTAAWPVGQKIDLTSSFFSKLTTFYATAVPPYTPRKASPRGDRSRERKREELLNLARVFSLAYQGKGFAGKTSKSFYNYAVGWLRNAPAAAQRFAEGIGGSGELPTPAGAGGGSTTGLAAAGGAFSLFAGGATGWGTPINGEGPFWESRSGRSRASSIYSLRQ